MSEEQPLPQPEVQPPHTATGSVDPKSVEGLFLAALANPDPDQRRAFLDETCPDEEQRRRVEALLRAHADAGSFLEKPAAGRDGAPGALDAPPRDEVPLDFLGPSDQPGCLGTLGPYQVSTSSAAAGWGSCFAPGHEAQPDRRGEGPRSRTGGKPQCPAPVLAGSPGRGSGEPSARGHDPCGGRGQTALSGHGMRRRPVAPRETRPSRVAATDGDAPHRPAGGRGSGRGTSTGAHPPRHQAGEHFAGKRRRAGQDHGLRPGACRR